MGMTTLTDKALARARSVELTMVAPGRYKAASLSQPGHEHELSVSAYSYPACNMAGCSCPCSDCAAGRHIGCRSGIKRERLTILCTCPGGHHYDERGSSTCVHAVALGLRLLEIPEAMALVPRPQPMTEAEAFAF